MTNQVAANLNLVNFIHELTVQDVVVSMYTNVCVGAGAPYIVLTVYSMYLKPQTRQP